MEQYVFYRPVNKKRFKGSALSRRLVSSNENLLASYLSTIPERRISVKFYRMVCPGGFPLIGEWNQPMNQKYSSRLNRAANSWAM